MNNFWTLVFMVGDLPVTIFHTEEKPTKLEVIAHASLIIPPNTVVPMKDRIGAFRLNDSGPDTEEFIIERLQAMRKEAPSESLD